jgi:hypothetical protein
MRACLCKNSLGRVFNSIRLHSLQKQPDLQLKIQHRQLLDYLLLANALLGWRRDNQHNDPQHNGTKQNNKKVSLSIIELDTAKLSVISAECRYGE